jgi:hypothetical protein
MLFVVIGTSTCSPNTCYQIEYENENKNKNVKSAKVISHHLLNVFVQLANKRGLKKTSN